MCGHPYWQTWLTRSQSLHDDEAPDLRPLVGYVCEEPATLCPELPVHCVAMVIKVIMVIVPEYCA